MLAELGDVNKIYIAVGTKHDLNPFEKGTLFLFCGRKRKRQKIIDILRQ